MLELEHLKADLKQIIREPVLVVFMFIPLFIFIVFKALIFLLFPYIYKVTGFKIWHYYAYVLSFSFLLIPQMLGTVAGFLMIDERDNKIYELMSITPLGYSGYIINRLLIPFVFGILYTFIGYYMLDIYTLNSIVLLLISILIGIEGIIASLILFNIADDKVKGLTISKTMGIFPLIGLVDILNIEWLSQLSKVFPYYWITNIITNSSNFKGLSMAAIIHILWAVIIIKIGERD